VLSQDLTLQVLDAWGRTVELTVAFGYDAGDPWAVWITFGRTGEPVRWAVGRDLLLRGLTDPAGEGDIQLFPSVDENGRAAVVMEFCSPHGRLVTQMRTSELYGFLSRTLAVVPLGTERIDHDLLVATLVGGSAPQ
jgi:Streptomyces sporulation and cell division protein, SsgA